jgi:hypothetical protein
LQLKVSHTKKLFKQSWSNAFSSLFNKQQFTKVNFTQQDHYVLTIDLAGFELGFYVTEVDAMLLRHATWSTKIISSTALK